MSLTLLPGLHLDGGRLREAPEKDAATLINELARRYEEAVVVDVAGLHRNMPDVVTLQKGAAHRTVWMDAGSRASEDVMDLFIAGASRVTARWASFLGADELQETGDLCDALYLGVEVGPDGLVQNKRHPTHPDALDDLLAGHEIGVVVIDLAAEDGRPSEGALRVGKAFTNHTERWYMGAVSRREVEPLAERGYEGAIVPLEVMGSEPPREVA